jgi:hypothetical protein
MLLKHPQTGLVRMPHHFLTTWMELWGFIKLPAQTKAVHMELRLRLSFHLSHSLRGYTVGTTTVFWVATMENLAHGLTTESHGGTRSNI